MATKKAATSVAEEDSVFELNNTQAGSYLEEKKKEADGLLRPKLTEGKDGKREMTLRFLPNLMSNGKIGPTAIEKHIHYADFKQNPELTGYFDCLKNTSIGKDCPICKAYWALAKSKNPEDQEKAKLINRTTKYYSYVYVVEDLQVPANQDKIFIFPFGFKILQKIKAKAEHKKRPYKVEDLIHGANFNLVIKEVAGFYNYDESEFDDQEPITFNGKQLEVEKDGSIGAEEKNRMIEFLKSREHSLDEFLPKDWSEEQSTKVQSILDYLHGSSESTARNHAKAAASTVVTSSQLFEDKDDDDDDEVETPATNASVKDAKAKAAKFFEDDED